jgi:hypothetical protein
MPHYVLVAFGQGVGASSAIPPVEVAEELRLVIEKALNVFETHFSSDLKISVAPNGVMLGFPDPTPDRAVQLVEAVQGQLEQAAKKGRPVIPVSSVITSGPMRSVDVLGHSSNFEGRPAIAAARILARLEPGLLAVGESAWGFEKLDQALGEPLTLQGNIRARRSRSRFTRGSGFPSRRGLPSGLRNPRRNFPLSSPSPPSRRTSGGSSPTTPPSAWSTFPGRKTEPSGSP